MKKRLLSLLLAVGMLIGMLSVGFAEEYAFADDDGTGSWTWASDYIYDCYEAGIINGYEDGTYLPDNELTRAEAAKIIALTFGLSSTATESTFSDVADTHWALQYIEACVEAGIINGYEDSTFLPGQNVTRAEMAKMIAVASGLVSDAAESSFSDVGTHWALQYIEACADAGIITGYEDGTFLPGNNITRAEAAAIISRTLDLLNPDEDSDDDGSSDADSGSADADSEGSTGSDADDAGNADIDSDTDTGEDADSDGDGDSDANGDADTDDNDDSDGSGDADTDGDSDSNGDTDDNDDSDNDETTAPEIISGDNQTWSADSETGLTVTSDADFADFISVSVDGEVISSEYYTVVSGSTIVTLSAEYMSTLSEGEHTLTITSSSGSATASFTVAAAATGDTGEDDEDDDDDDSEVASGTCGDEVYWVLTSNGTLTISGTGDMDDYSSYEVPWYNWGSEITSVVIAKGVTSIGNRAFYACENLTSIEIPSTVTTIGNYAFFLCTSLMCIEIPESVTSISGDAFNECTCLTAINVDSGNISYASEDGVLFDFDMAELIRYPEEKPDTEYDIPSSVTTIGNYAFFACENLTSIEIPLSVTVIDSKAFEYCYSLTSIEIPSSVTTIGREAFGYCYSLTSIEIPSGVTTIRSGTFEYCYSLTSIEIPSTVTSIDDYAFDFCTSLMCIEIPSGVTTIGKLAFGYCESLTSIDIPSSVTSIGDRAFTCCTSLTAINVDSGNTDYISIDGVLFNYDITELIQYPSGKTDTVYEIPSGVMSIGSYAFYDCSCLTSVTIPNSVTSIGESAFDSCESLTCVSIGSGVITIGKLAFSSCTALTSITIPDSVTSIGVAAFSDCYALISVIIGSGVTTIREMAFLECTSLTYVYYTGSEEDWAEITIYFVGNTYLTSANITYNYTG